MEWIQLIISLSGVIGLIILLYYLMRKLNKRFTVTGGSKLRVIDRANTGRDSSLLVVSVGGKLMLIGVSAGKIEKLCDLDISEEEYLEPSAQSQDRPAGNFSDVLSNMRSNFLTFGAKKGEATEKPPKGEGEENTVEPDSQTSNKREGT